MSVQLVITAVMTLVPYMNEGIRISILKNPGLVLVAAFSGLILSCMLFCIHSLAKKVPTNYILMFAFTICEAYTVAFIAAVVGDALIVIQAAFLTAGLVIGLTFYAMTTKTDFTVMGSALWSVGALFLVFSLFSVFFGPTMRLIYCVFGVMLFSVYLIFDT
jgi:FtsH-binding integral membrane protein